MARNWLRQAFNRRNYFGVGHHRRGRRQVFRRRFAPTRRFRSRVHYTKRTWKRMPNNFMKIKATSAPVAMVMKKAGVSGSVHFNLAAMLPKWAQIAEHFEQLRVNKVRLHFTPYFSRGGAFDDSGTILPDQKVYFCYNKLSENPEPDLREDVVCFPKVFSKTARQRFTWNLKPHMRQHTAIGTVADNGAVGSATISTSIPFRYVNPNDSNVSGINPIYGAQFYMDALPDLGGQEATWADDQPIWNVTCTAEIHAKGLNYIAPPGGVKNVNPNEPFFKFVYKE